jgi:hypothetical protein
VLIGTECHLLLDDHDRIIMILRRPSLFAEGLRAGTYSDLQIEDAIAFFGIKLEVAALAGSLNSLWDQRGDRFLLDFPLDVT